MARPAVLDEAAKVSREIDPPLDSSACGAHIAAAIEALK